MDFIPCYCEMLPCDSTLWIPGKHFGWTDGVWDTLIATPISWEQLWSVRKMMLPHVCARPHCAGYTDQNTNLMGATWSVRKMVLPHVCARPNCRPATNQYCRHYLPVTMVCCYRYNTEGDLRQQFLGLIRINVKQGPTSLITFHW